MKMILHEMMENKKRMSRTTFTTSPAWMIIWTTFPLNAVPLVEALGRKIRVDNVSRFIRISSSP
jgi:hypothetical protein